MFTRIAKDGAMSYLELKRLPVFEFFHIFKNYIEDLKKQGNRYSPNI